MRVLTVALLYPPHHLGGYELVCEGVVRAAHIRGHDVRVLTSDFSAPAIDAPDEPYVERALRSYRDASAERSAALGWTQRLALERANALVFDRVLREFAPDVVSWWAMGGMSLSLIERARRRGLASLLAIHDDWLSYGFQADSWTRMTRRLQALSPLLEPIAGIPMRYRLERAGRFLFNSESTLRAAAAGGLVPLDCEVVPPGVHARFLAPAPSDPWGWRLLHVGRLDPAKGIDLAVAALARLPSQSTLKIVGSGGDAYTARLSEQAHALGVGDRVELVGPVEPTALVDLYAAADAVVFPIRWEEPWGLVPLEAMGVGRPVVAVARGGARAYLRDEENSLVIGPEDPDAIAAAVQRLAGDERLRARLRSGGLRTAAEHSATRFEQQVVDELERLAASGPDAVRVGVQTPAGRIART